MLLRERAWCLQDVNDTVFRMRFHSTRLRNLGIKTISAGGRLPLTLNAASHQLIQFGWQGFPRAVTAWRRIGETPFK